MLINDGTNVKGCFQIGCMLRKAAIAKLLSIFIEARCEVGCKVGRSHKKSTSSPKSKTTDPLRNLFKC